MSSPQRIRWIGIVVSAVLYVGIVVVGLVLFGWHLWWPFVAALLAVAGGFLVVWLLFRA